MKKRLFGLAVFFVLCIAMMTVPALATDYDLWVNGIQVTTENANDVLGEADGDGATVTYDASTHTLTLNNATITQGHNGGPAITTTMDTITVELVGDNTIDYPLGGIHVEHDLTFTGTGTLTAIGQNPFTPILAKNNITVDGATLYVTSPKEGAIQAGAYYVEGEGFFTVKNGGYVEATGLYYGVWANNLSVTENSTLRLTSTQENCYALTIYDNAFIEDSTVEIGEGSFGGFYAASNISLFNGTITTNATTGWGTWANGDITISGEATNYTAKGNIGASGNITISGGTISECKYVYSNGNNTSVKVEGGHIIGGIVQNDAENGDIHISSGTLEDIKSIYASQGSIYISGGDISTKNPSGNAINAANKIEISDGYVYAISTGVGTPAITGGQQVDILGGEIFASSYGMTIQANAATGGILNIKGAKVTSESSSTGDSARAALYASGQVTIENAEVTASAGTSAIVANEKMVISNSIVKATGGDGSYTVYSRDLDVSGSWMQLSGNLNEEKTTVTDSVVFYGDQGKVAGNATVPENVEVPENNTLTVPSGASLTVPTVLTNNNAIVVEGDMIVTADGQVTGEGSISVSGALAYQGTGTDAVAGTVTLANTGKVYSQSDISTILSNAIASEDKTYQETDYAYAWEKAPNVYAIVLPMGVNGTVTASPESATENVTVTLTVTPGKGYELKSLTVIRTEDDSEVQTDPAGENKFSFQMPDSDVTVNVQFQIIHCDGDTGCPSDAYEDVEEDTWYHDYVDFVLRRGYMVGISEDPYIFGTELHLTRAQAIQTLYQIEGKPGTSYVTDYNDVSDNQWFAQAIAWGTENGIVEGRDDGTFDPDGNITREELVTMLYRYVKEYKALSVETAGGIPETFVDRDQVGSYAVDAFAWAIDRGIVNGMTETTLEPQTLSRRCEMAKLIASLCAVYPEIP